MRLSNAGMRGPNSNRIAPLPVTFDRREFSTILAVYGRKVSRGEWKDYALEFGRDRARFCVFKRASDVPTLYIEKDPRLRHKQGMYRVTSAQGRVLRRGHELERVLKVIDHDLVVIK
jgi:hypothetical protein